MSNKVAAPGNVFVCTACGKMSNDLYGFQPISYGWDASCTLKCVEIEKSRLVIENNLVVEVKEQ